MDRFAIITTFMGPVLVGATDRGVCLVHLGDSPAELPQFAGEWHPRAREIHPGEAASDWAERIRRSIDSPTEPCDVYLDAQGTDFQKRVWRELCRIPAGATITYGELARSIGAPKAVRAVAAACGANPIAVIVPCHRVIGQDGTLTGYAGGLHRKKLLLDREARLASPPGNLFATR